MTSRILATLCYVKRDGSTLMVHRIKKANDIHQGKWNGLGGKFEAGETPEECVIREVLEESGLTIQDPKYCGLLMFPKFKGNDWYVFVFTATDFTGELIDSPEGRLEWIPDEKLLNLNLWESDHIFFPWIEEGRHFSAKFEYEGDVMRGYNVVFYSYERSFSIKASPGVALCSKAGTGSVPGVCFTSKFPPSRCSAQSGLVGFAFILENL